MIRRRSNVRHEYEASIRSNAHNCLEGNADFVEAFYIEPAYDDASRCRRTPQGADEPVRVEYTMVPST
jgi:CopG family nickel-responsive transcriptional regulator